MSPAPGTQVHAPTGRIASFRARTLLEPLVKTAVDLVLVRLGVPPPQVLSQGIQSRLNESRVVQNASCVDGIPEL
jgi:hypothetical protein